MSSVKTGKMMSSSDAPLADNTSFPMADKSRRAPLPRRKYSGATSDRVLERFAFWLVICLLCAGTSLLWAFSGWHPGGVLVGVAIVAALYTALSGTDFFRRWRRNPRNEQAMRIGFGTRVFIEILFPIGGVLDFFIGFQSVTIAKSLWKGGGASFGVAVGTVLIDAAFQNAILWVFILIVYALLSSTPSEYESDADRCAHCEYDLRGSKASKVCPECGTPTSWATQIDSQTHHGTN